MSHKLPIGVLIPTRNCMPFLPGHLQTMQPWLDLAEEIVVVDSESRDGTTDFLKERLPAGQTRFFNHPPGLYESWNYGLRRITSRYVYISTVGDGITKGGIEHLLEVAEEQSCDAVVSPPRFVDAAGKPTRANNWPVHDLISILDLREPACLGGLTLFAVALSFLPFAVLGSSASNLYRTRVLQDNPFPIDFGTNGDGAWGLIHAPTLRLGITPQCFSFFRQHSKTYTQAAYHASDGDQRMYQLGMESLEQFLETTPDVRRHAHSLEFKNVIIAKEQVQRWRHQLIEYRRSPWPWSLRRAAWRARRNRDAAQRHCLNLVKDLLSTHGISAEVADLTATIGLSKPISECPV